MKENKLQLVSQVEVWKDARGGMMALDNPSAEEIEEFAQIKCTVIQTACRDSTAR